MSRKNKLALECGVLCAASALAAKTAPHGIDVRAAVGTAAVAIPAWILGDRILRQYDVGKGPGLALVTVWTSTLAVTVTCLVGAVSTLWSAPFAPLTMTHFFAALWAAALAIRVAVPALRARLPAPPPGEILVVGIGPLGRHTARRIHESSGARAVIHHLSFPDEAIDDRSAGAVLGKIDDLERVLRTRALDEVYIAGNPLRHGHAMQAAVRVCERFGVPFALPVTPFRLERARPADSRAIADGYIHYRSAEHKPHQLVLKRLIDIIVSAAALVILAPLLVTVALLVVLTSPGPVLFRQARVGRHGRPFMMLKFRSMIVGAEAMKEALAAKNEQTGPVFKIGKDPRVTRVGAFLRKYSIDELPQFLNVLRGDMSIVGPRPPLPDEVARYEPWQRRRLSVRPGITCMWQVSGRNEISFEEWMYLDMRYIDHWNIGEDIKLILKTVPVVVSGRGAS